MKKPSPTSPIKPDTFSKEFYFISFFILFIFILIVWLLLPSTRFENFIGSGDSMEPTFSSGDELIVDPKKDPKIDDVIVFSCVSCDGISPEEILTKRLIRNNDSGCFWLEGDNPNNSLDSRTFGWLCAQDIKIFGVVVGVK